MTKSGPTRGRAGFPETHWSQLVRVGDLSDPRHAEHLNGLLQHYWKPVYHYVRAMRRLNQEDAEDLTQGFFAMVLTRVDFAKLSPERGSFRGFLKTALQRFVLNSERSLAARAQKKQSPIFDYGEAEAQAGLVENLTPEDAFDRAWAREILEEAFARVEAELQAQGKAIYYQVFREYCVDPTEEKVSYDSLAARHDLKADDVRNYLRVVRRRARELIAERVRDYLFPDEDVEAELRFILSS